MTANRILPQRKIVDAPGTLSGVARNGRRIKTNSGINRIGNPCYFRRMTKITRRNLQYGILAFVDLLGFSDRVARIETEEDLIELDEDISFVQTQFEHQAPEDFIKESHRLMKKRVRAFSDCLVISVPIQSQLSRVQGAFDTLLGELDSFALAQGMCVNRRIFLRGGVDIGFLFSRRASLISPALVKSYNLERAASAPLIALTPELRTYLTEHPGRTAYSADADPIAWSLMDAENLPNGESHCCLNYFGTCLRNVDPAFDADDQRKLRAVEGEERDTMVSEAWQSAALAWAQSHGDAIRAGYQGAGTNGVREKYIWLAGYHDREVEKFFGAAGDSVRIGSL